MHKLKISASGFGQTDRVHWLTEATKTGIRTMTKTIRQIRHELVDLKSEVNKERDREITVVKQDYLETVSIARQMMKNTITGIKATYRQIYADKKVELIAEKEV